MRSISDVIDLLSEVVGAAVDVTPTGIVDRPTLPAVLIYPDEAIGGGTYFRTMRGGVFDLPVVVHVVCSAIELEGGQAWLWDAISPWSESSIPAALLAAPSLATGPLALAGVSVHVERVDDIGFSSLFDGTRVLQAKVRVLVKLTKEW